MEDKKHEYIIKDSESDNRYFTFSETEEQEHSYQEDFSQQHSYQDKSNTEEAGNDGISNPDSDLEDSHKQELKDLLQKAGEGTPEGRLEDESQFIIDKAPEVPFLEESEYLSSGDP